MRHRKGNAKLGRPTDQRLAMLRELASGVIYDTRIETTLVRAKATRPYLEKLITKAVHGMKADQAAEAASGDDKQILAAKAVHLRPRCAASCSIRPWSSTCSTRSRRTSRSGPVATRGSSRPATAGDGAEMAILEFVSNLRVAALVAYDGTDFAGFQRQASDRTVQGALEAGLAALYGQPIGLRGAGRTDAGVHARGQVIAADVPETVPAERWPEALNPKLPLDVRVRESWQAADRFDPRRQASSRSTATRWRWIGGRTRCGTGSPPGLVRSWTRPRWRLPRRGWWAPGISCRCVA